MWSRPAFDFRSVWSALPWPQPPDECLCHASDQVTFIGADCSLRQCHHPGMLLGECPSNSNCNFTTGICDCIPGFIGHMCELLKCPGAGDCSKHGLCNHTTGECSCFQGFQGSECEQYLCLSIPEEYTNTSVAIAVEAAPLASCRSTQIDGFTCCTAAQDIAAAYMIASIMTVDTCHDQWSRMVCGFHCSPTQGQWAMWETSARTSPKLSLLAVDAEANITRSSVPELPASHCTDFCCTRNNTCCFGIQAAVQAVQTPFCSKTLLHFLYAVHCDQADSDEETTLTICSNFTSDLYTACSDEPAFGYSIRRTFLDATEFVDSMLPANVTVDIVSDGDCITGPQQNETMPPPPGNQSLHLRWSHSVAFGLML